MRGVWRLRRLARQTVPRAIILLYHRIAEVPVDPQLLCVSPQHFTEHLNVLRRRYHPLSLKSLRRRLAFNLWRPGSAVITFDDGYADNLHRALPVLRAADVPATVFVTAGTVDSRQQFWWDRLKRVLLCAPLLPSYLRLTVNGRVYHWDLHRGNGNEQSGSSWHVLMSSSPTLRQIAYRDLVGLLRGMEAEDRKSRLRELEAWVGLDADDQAQDRALTSDQVRMLARDGLVEVGAHTVSHPVLSALPIGTQEEEIAGSKRKLDRILGQPVTSFAYPFGTRGDYTADTVKLVRDIGFECACANFPGSVTLKSDPYQFPRFVVHDWDGEEFARRLAAWFDG